LERESLTREEFLALLEGEQPQAVEVASAPAAAPPVETAPAPEKGETAEPPAPAKRLKPRTAPS
ncbi:MAG: hypothetical protein NZL85_07225, partial [Fimbriimonadales bacterium]|nr:hypothetical protein [Fimbriimonadales bacterium]